MSKESIPIPDIMTADVMITLDKKEVNGISRTFYFDREVFQMAVGIQNMLDKHAPEKGDSWKDMDAGQLLYRMREEYKELDEAIREEKPETEIASEAMDVALFALFCWYLHTTFIGVKP